jgi:hypothetical protein
MTVQQQQQPSPARYVDVPGLSEIFADSLHTMVWDGATLRIEFCITRFAEAPPAGSDGAKRFPVCRMVLTSAAAVDLFNRLQQTMAALAQAGVVSQQKPPAAAQGAPAGKSSG